MLIKRLVAKFRFFIKMQKSKYNVWKSSKWQRVLFKKYPELFRQKNLSMRESAMYWGIQTGGGWKDILDVMCIELSTKYPNTEFIQIKEKFGLLRVYFKTAHDYDTVARVVNSYESMSAHICESCGNSKAEMRNDDGWLSVRCNTCHDKHTNIV